MSIPDKIVIKIRTVHEYVTTDYVEFHTYLINKL